MEVFNDAVANAAGAAPVVDPTSPLPLLGVTLHSPALAAAHLIPGIEKKRDIVLQMRAWQEGYPRPSDSRQATIYDRFQALPEAIETRTVEQQRNIMRWVNDPGRD